MRKKKEIKLENIARELNTSTVTVSNALNGKKGVGEELRRKILDRAAELGYRPPQNPVKKEQRLHYIGVIAAENGMKEVSSAQMEIYKEIVREAGTKKCMTSLVLMNEEIDERKCLFESLGELNIDGLILLGEMKEDIMNEIRRKMKVPMVGIDACKWPKSPPPGMENGEIREMILTVYEQDKRILAKTGLDFLLSERMDSGLQDTPGQGVTCMD